MLAAASALQAPWRTRAAGVGAALRAWSRGRERFCTATEDLLQFKARIGSIGPGSVDLSLDGKTGLATLELCNEKRSNGKMMVELAEAVRELESWERGVALLVRGQGHKAFCAGADLDLARNHLTTSEDGRLMCALMTDTLNRMRRLPLVSVSVLEGAAVGGGAELATATDFRVASAGARIRFVQVQMGVSTGWGGAARLVALVGRGPALRLLAWGEPVGAEEALRLGLVDDVVVAAAAVESASAGPRVVPGAVQRRAEAFVRPVTEQKAFRAVRAAKTAVAAAGDIAPEVCRAEREAFLGVWGGLDNRASLEGRGTPVVGSP